MELYFSKFFGVDAKVLEDYGAFDISVVSDLPLFIDPFLLFNSEKDEYQALHQEILKYLTFLRSHASADLDPGLIQSWYRFKEVKQNWFGYTLLGNGGAGLGADFAVALHDSLGQIFKDFGDESITSSSHLEKLCLIRDGVGKDSISDFTTNLIKAYLLRYTERFARAHLGAKHCDTHSVERAVFNYETETWVTKGYYLPKLGRDFVLLTPIDILTREDTWISSKDMIRSFERLPQAVPDAQLRAQINQYFRQQLGKNPNAAKRREAAAATLRAFPDLVDYYIKRKEDTGDRARAISAELVEDTHAVLNQQVQLAIAALEKAGGFYDKPNSSYAECLTRVKAFKDFVEKNDGYRVINRAGKAFAKETEVQIFFSLIWYRTYFDVNREVNNGRGPVDVKVSAGSFDKTLIEFKLGSNKALKRNLLKQVAIYEAANGTRQSVKAIVYYTRSDEAFVRRVLKELKLENEESIVLIDARSDNKPSASKAK